MLCHMCVVQLVPLLTGMIEVTCSPPEESEDKYKISDTGSKYFISKHFSYFCDRVIYIGTLTHNITVLIMYSAPAYHY